MTHEDEIRALGEEYVQALADEQEERTAEQVQQEAEAIRDMAEQSRDRDDAEALTLVGAVVGDYFIKGRIKPGKRWRYVAHNTRTGKEHYLQGYELVRQVKATVRHGGVVIMPTHPWVNET